MLSPFRYYEDVACNDDDDSAEKVSWRDKVRWTDNFPFVSMGPYPVEKGDIYSQLPIHFWYKYPYKLTSDDLLSSHQVRWYDTPSENVNTTTPATFWKKLRTPNLRCNSCNEELFFDSWYVLHILDLF